MPNDNLAIEQFISEKRQQGQNDAIILEELIAGGWDRTAALKALGGAIPSPMGSSKNQIPQTSQTGSMQTPIQVENLQYTMKVGKVRSKIGLNMLIVSILSWLITFVLLYLLLALSSAILPDSSFSEINYQDALMLSVAVLVPVLPLWIYGLKRLNKGLSEDPASIDDVFFKRTVRFNFFLWLLVTIFWTIATIYNILDKVVKADASMTAQNIMNSFIFTFVFGALTYFFWHYQLKTKR